MLVSAVTSVLLRDTVWAIGAFSSSMVLIAFLYLMIGPFLLCADVRRAYATAGCRRGALCRGRLSPARTAECERPASRAAVHVRGGRDRPRRLWDLGQWYADA